MQEFVLEISSKYEREDLTGLDFKHLPKRLPTIPEAQTFNAKKSGEIATEYQDRNKRFKNDVRFSDNNNNNNNK